MDVSKLISAPVLLHATTALVVNNGVIGGTGAAAGAANDTRLMSVLIVKNAGAPTLTIVGFKGEDGVSRSVVLTGSTTLDTWYSFPGLKNSGGAMTLTASVADTILVGLQGG